VKRRRPPQALHLLQRELQTLTANANETVSDRGAWSVGSLPGLLFLRCGIGPANHPKAGHTRQPETQIGSQYRFRYCHGILQPKNVGLDYPVIEAWRTTLPPHHRSKNLTSASFPALGQNRRGNLDGTSLVRDRRSFSVSGGRHRRKCRI
jgi:hypothetical protein